REPARAWLLLSLALFVILTNFLESIWMRGMDMLWVMFVIVVAETGRHWQRTQLSMPRYGPLRSARPAALLRRRPPSLPNRASSAATLQSPLDKSGQRHSPR